MQASKLPGRAIEELAAEGQPDAHVAGDDFPAATALRLIHQVAFDFEAGLRLLADAETSYSAESLFRTLIEALTHFAFIYSKGNAAEWRCKAICLEMGFGQQLVGLLRSVEDAPPPAFDGMASEAASRKRILTDLHGEAGCACEPRTYRDVQHSLREFKDDANLAWLHSAWVTASAYCHILLPDRTIKAVGPGRSGVVLPSVEERAARMDMMVFVFGQIAAIFLELVGKGDRKSELLVDVKAVRLSLEALVKAEADT